MSRARRIAHRSLVYSRQGQRRLARRNHECRVRHWRKMLGEMVFDNWRRPMDQDVRVAYLTVRCREHRSQAAVSMVISRFEEEVAYGTDGLLNLITLRIRDATMTVHKMLVPRRYRREMAV